ncbi:MAG: iron-containing alcohol dehydrogenase [Desulfopila sp.]
MADTLITAQLDLPTSWRHGRGLAAQAGVFVRQLKATRALVLTDPILNNSGVLTPVTSSLTAHDIPFIVCDAVDREPTVLLFDELLSRLDLSSFDVIIAVGGGSVLDVAKGIALIASFGGHIRDYAGHGKVPGIPRIPTIAIPTTAGTGSEISDGVVLIDEERQTKFLVLSKKICPTLALTDPLLTITMPAKVTACSGMDALVHAVESYLSKDANIATELFSLRAIGLLSENIRQAYNDGSDITARENMQLGSTLAMMAGMNAYLGLCHAMAMPLCALYHIPHGQVCGLLLPHILEYNAAVCRKKIATVFGVISAKGSPPELTSGLAQVERLIADLGLSARLGELGYTASHMDTIVEATLASAQCPTNPRNPSAEDIAAIVANMI